MKKLWFPVLVMVAFLVGCSPDKTIETLIPRDSLAVVLVDHPGLIVQAWGQGGAFPLSALDPGKPWAAAVVPAASVPAAPPGFILLLALADKPSAWSDVERWARERGGLVATKVGAYAILSAPGLPEPGVLDLDRRFDLSRVRVGADPLAIYIDVKNVMDLADFPEALQPLFVVLPWAEKNLSGLRLGVAPKDGGLELRFATDWKPEFAGKAALLAWSAPDASNWTGLLPETQGLGVVAALPPQGWAAVGQLLPDPALQRRWETLGPFLGPRVAVSLSPGVSGPWGWSLAVETSDPQAVRQALRTLVASGDLQKNFSRWAIDSDTALIYRDTLLKGDPRALVSFGPTEFQIAYASDRVVFAGGPGTEELLSRWAKALPGPASWASQGGSGAAALASGSLDGLGARAALRVLKDGNVELRVWTDAVGLKAWAERFPQAALSWLSGPGGWTRAEP